MEVIRWVCLLGMVGFLDFDYAGDFDETSLYEMPIPIRKRYDKLKSIFTIRDSITIIHDRDWISFNHGCDKAGNMASGPCTCTSGHPTEMVTESMLFTKFITKLKAPTEAILQPIMVSLFLSFLSYKVET